MGNERIGLARCGCSLQLYMVLPMDTSHAKVPTDVRMTYDSDNIYIFVNCYLTKPGPYMVESLCAAISYLARTITSFSSSTRLTTAPMVSLLARMRQGPVGWHAVRWR